jgi:hypothetical protein
MYWNDNRGSQVPQATCVTRKVNSMPLTGIETVTLGYKIADLTWEMGKALRNSVQVKWSRAPYRIISSLTTMEFVQEGAKQTAYYVQDRTLAFLKADTRLPPFLYATDGKDFIDGLTVENANKAFTSRVSPEKLTLIGPTDDIVYNKGDHARAILFAHSEDGFTNPREGIATAIRQPTDSSTVVVVFPPERKPASVELRYREQNDPLDSWRPARREKYEVRRTTRGRLAFYWEESNLPCGRTYSVDWDW